MGRLRTAGIAAVIVGVGIVAVSGWGAALGVYGERERHETADGFEVKQESGLLGPLFGKKGDVVFEHNQVLNYETLWGWPDGGAHVAYRDNGCDGIVDRLCAIECYNRDQEGTEALFAKADKDFARYKKELGVE